MLSTKVKISHVNNLTDARYFAAAGVDYLGFCCNPGTEKYCTISKINEIRQWVEGPEFVLEFDGWQPETDIHHMIRDGLGQLVHFGAFATYQDDFGVPVFKDFILENLSLTDFSGVDYPVLRSQKKFDQMDSDEIASLRNLAGEKTIFLDIPFEISELEGLIAAFPGFGLILRGGEEEKTGFKSFDDLDRVFEVLGNQ